MAKTQFFRKPGKRGYRDMRTKKKACTTSIAIFVKNIILLAVPARDFPGDFCPGGFLSRGILVLGDSLSRGISCPMGFLVPGFFCPGDFVIPGILMSRGICPPGDLAVPKILSSQGFCSPGNFAISGILPSLGFPMPCQDFTQPFL